MRIKMIYKEQETGIVYTDILDVLPVFILSSSLLKDKTTVDLGKMANTFATNVLAHAQTLDTSNPKGKRDQVMFNMAAIAINDGIPLLLEFVYDQCDSLDDACVYYAWGKGYLVLLGDPEKMATDRGDLMFGSRIYNNIGEVFTPPTDENFNTLIRTVIVAVHELTHVFFAKNEELDMDEEWYRYLDNTVAFSMSEEFMTLVYEGLRGLMLYPEFAKLMEYIPSGLNKGAITDIISLTNNNRIFASVIDKGVENSKVLVNRINTRECVGVYQELGAIKPDFHDRNAFLTINSDVYEQDPVNNFFRLVADLAGSCLYLLLTYVPHNTSLHSGNSEVFVKSHESNMTRLLYTVFNNQKQDSRKEIPEYAMRIASIEYNEDSEKLSLPSPSDVIEQTTSASTDDVKPINS